MEKSLWKEKNMFINLYTFLHKSGMITFCCKTSLARQFQTGRVPKAEKLSKTASIKIVLISRLASEFQGEVIRICDIIATADFFDRWY